MQARNHVEPITWAVWGAIFGAVFGTIAAMAGHQMPQTPMEAAMGGLFWGWVAALVRNKLAH